MGSGISERMDFHGRGFKQVLTGRENVSRARDANPATAEQVDVGLDYLP